MVNVIAPSAVDSGIEPARLGQANDNWIVICYISARHAA